MGVLKYYSDSPDGVYQWDQGVLASGASTVIDIKDIPELQAVEISQKGLAVGAAVTVSKMVDIFEGMQSNGHKESHFNVLSPYAVIARHLRRVANVQVRVAT